MILTADSSDCAGFVLVLLVVMVDLDITGRLLIGMGKKLEPAELCFHTLARNRTNKLMWSMVHNNSKAGWGAVVFLVCVCIMTNCSCSYL
jgi:hypothetical protein